MENALGVEPNTLGLNPDPQWWWWVSQKMPEPQFPHPSKRDEHSSQGCLEGIVHWMGKELYTQQSTRKCGCPYDSMSDYATLRRNYHLFVLRFYILPEYRWGMVSQLKSTLLFKTLFEEMLLKAGVVLHGIIHSMWHQCYRDKLRKVNTSGWCRRLALSVSAEEKQ